MSVISINHIRLKCSSCVHVARWIFKNETIVTWNTREPSSSPFIFRQQAYLCHVQVLKPKTKALLCTAGCSAQNRMWVQDVLLNRFHFQNYFQAVCDLLALLVQKNWNCFLSESTEIWMFHFQLQENMLNLLVSNPDYVYAKINKLVKSYTPTSVFLQMMIIMHTLF